MKEQGQAPGQGNEQGQPPNEDKAVPNNKPQIDDPEAVNFEGEQTVGKLV